MTKKVLFYSVATILLFSFIYQFSLSFLGIPEVLHSSRISSIALIFFAIIHGLGKKGVKLVGLGKYPLKPPYRSFLWLVAFLTLFSFLQYQVIGKLEGIHLFECMMNIVIFTIPVTWAILNLFDKLDDLMIVILLTGVIQSAIILICIIEPSLSTVIDLTFNANLLDFTQDHRTWYAGGIGCITSTGVIRYSTCLIPCVYFYFNKRKNSYLLLYFFFSFIAAMIARTGLVFSLVGLLFVLNRGNFIKNTFRVGIVAVSIIVVGNIFYTDNYGDLFQDKFKRLTSLKEQGVKKGFLDGYFKGEETIIPPIESGTIFGTGMVTGLSGNGYRVHVDGGPLRMYGALGLPFVLFTYFCALYLMIKICRTAKIPLYKKALWILFCFIIIGDLKDFTLFQVWPFCLFYSVALLSRKEYYKYLKCNL